jgi:hypothetical protein
MAQVVEHLPNKSRETLDLNSQTDRQTHTHTHTHTTQIQREIFYIIITGIEERKLNS